MFQPMFYKDEKIFIIEDNSIITIVGEEDEADITDYEFPFKPENLFYKNGVFVFSSENKIIFYDYEKESLLKSFDSDKNQFYYDERGIFIPQKSGDSIIIKQYNSDFKEINSFSFTTQESQELYIDDEYFILNNLWDNEESETESPEGSRGFYMDGDDWIFFEGATLHYGSLSKDESKSVIVDFFINMDVTVKLKDSSVYIFGRDGEYTQDVFIPHLSFQREKRRGGIEKIIAIFLKRGVDLVAPVISESGKYWFGVDGEEYIFPLLLNLKTREPIAVFNDPFSSTAEIKIGASDDFSKLFLLTESKLLISYEWNEGGIIKDYEISLLSE
ncbi:hypothetical protein JXR93_05110 [bacterium]|nr:hypothetical protein [bacterium]